MNLRGTHERCPPPPAMTWTSDSGSEANVACPPKRKRTYIHILKTPLISVLLKQSQPQPDEEAASVPYQDAEACHRSS